MQFAPKSEEQLKLESLLAEGEYDFEIIKAEDTHSKKSGAEMIALEMKVFRADGNGFVFVKDYLLASMAFKLIHFAKATGLTEEYNKGTLVAATCLGRCGKVKVKVEEANGDFGAKNSVKDYVVPKEAAHDAIASGNPRAPVRAATLTEAEIPF